jgi:hypothetical protein
MRSTRTPQRSRGYAGAKTYRKGDNAAGLLGFGAALIVGWMIGSKK